MKQLLLWFTLLTPLLEDFNEILCLNVTASRKGFPVPTSNINFYLDSSLERYSYNEKYVEMLLKHFNSKEQMRTLFILHVTKFNEN